MSCLFNSLSHFLPISSSQIRKEVCDYLAENKPILDGLETSKIIDTNYINTMRGTSTWGGGVEIQAVCNLYKVRIIVESLRTSDRKNKPIVFIPVTGSGFYLKSCYLTWTGSHYESSKKPLLIV